MRNILEGSPLKSALDLVLRGLAALLAASLVIAGWHDVSQAYDVWYYHLPFAARLAVPKACEGSNV